MSLNQIINPVKRLDIKCGVVDFESLVSENPVTIDELEFKAQNDDIINLSSLPDKGTGGYVLTSDGDGNVSWTEGGTGGGVNYNGTVPVTVGKIALYNATNGLLINESSLSETDLLSLQTDVGTILNSNLITYNGNIPAVVGSLAIINQVNGKFIKNSTITESQVSGAISSISSIESDITNLQTQTLNLSSDGAGLSSILGTLSTGTLNATNINCDNIISLSTIRTIAPGHTISEPGRYRISLTHTNTANLFSINYNNWCSIYNAYFTSVSPIGTQNIWIVAVNVAYLENQVNEQAIANVTQIGGTPRPSELNFSVSGTGPYNSMVECTPAAGAGSVTSTYEFSIIYG